MEDNKNRKALYDAISGSVDNLGTYEEFSNRLDDDGNVKALYDALNENGVVENLGDYDTFHKRVGKQVQQETNNANTVQSTVHQTTGTEKPVEVPENPAQSVQSSAAVQQAADVQKTQQNENQAPAQEQNQSDYVYFTDGSKMLKTDWENLQAKDRANRERYGAGYVTMKDGTILSKEDYEHMTKRQQTMSKTGHVGANDIREFNEQQQAMLSDPNKEKRTEYYARFLPEEFKAYKDKMWSLHNKNYKKASDRAYLQAWWSMKESSRRGFLARAKQKNTDTSYIPQSYKDAATKKWGRKGSKEAYISAWDNETDEVKQHYLQREAEAMPANAIDKQGDEILKRTDERMVESKYVDPITMASRDEKVDTPIGRMIRKSVEEAKFLKGEYEKEQSEGEDVTTTLPNGYAGSADIMGGETQRVTMNTKGLKQAGRGFVHGVKNLDNWVMGMESLAKTAEMMTIVDKLDRGQTLTQEEQDLYDAVSMEFAASALYGNQLSSMYKSGDTTGASLPFLVQFMLTGGASSAAGEAASAAAKKEISGGLKRMAIWMMRNKAFASAASKIGSSKLAKGASWLAKNTVGKEFTVKYGTKEIATDLGKKVVDREVKTTAGDLLLKAIDGAVVKSGVSGAVQTAIWNIPAIIGGTLDRNMGSKEIALNASKLTGVTYQYTPAESMAVSLLKEATSQYAQNYTEFLGNNLFDPLLTISKNGAKQALSATTKAILGDESKSVIRSAIFNKVGAPIKALCTLAKNDKFARIGKLASQSFYQNGLFGEYLEEVANNIISYSIGDMSWDDLTGAQQNLDTVMGLMWTSGAFAFLNAGSRIAGYAHANAMVANSDGDARVLINNDANKLANWENFTKTVKQSDFAGVEQAYNDYVETLDKNAPEYKKLRQAALQYASNSANLMGLQATEASEKQKAQEKTGEEQPVEVTQVEQAEEEGAAITTQDERQKMVMKMDESEKQLSGVVGQYDNMETYVQDMFGETPEEQLKNIREADGISRDQKIALTNYVIALQKYKAMNETAQAQIQSQVDQRLKDIDKRTNKTTGKIVFATFGDQNGCIIAEQPDGTVSFLTEGSDTPIQINKHQLTITSEQDAEQYRTMVENAARQEAEANMQQQMTLPDVANGRTTVFGNGTRVVVNYRGQNVSGTVSAVAQNANGIEGYKVTLDNELDGKSVLECAPDQVYSEAGVQAQNQARQEAQEELAEEGDSLIAPEEEAPEETPAEGGEELPAETVDAVEQPARIPLTDQGEKDFVGAGIEETLKHFVQTGLSEEQQKKVVQNNVNAAAARVEQANAELEKAKNEAPNTDDILDPEMFKQVQDEWNNNVNQAQAIADQANRELAFWQAMNEVLNVNDEDATENEVTTDETQAEVPQTDQWSEEQSQEGGIVLGEGETLSSLAKEIKASVKVLKLFDAIAKRMNTKVVFDNFIYRKGVDGSIEGVKDKEGVVHLSKIEIRQGHKTAAFLLGHEFTHKLRNQSRASINAFMNVAQRYIGENEWRNRFVTMAYGRNYLTIAANSDKMKEKFSPEVIDAARKTLDAIIKANQFGFDFNMKSASLTGEDGKQVQIPSDVMSAMQFICDYVNEEVSADVAGDMMTNETTAKKMAKVPVGIMEKIVETIKELISKLPFDSETKHMRNMQRLWETAIENKRNGNTSEQEAYSVAAQEDKEYMDAVAAGDVNTEQKLVDEAAERAGYTVAGYHGTTNRFNVFDRSKGNPEGDWGVGFYFTNSEEDVEENYANNNGADLTNKIELLAEQLESTEDYDDATYEERLEAARKMISEGNPVTLECYLKVENPVIIGGPNETFFDLDENYDEETDEYGEPEGLMVDFVETINQVLEEDYMCQGTVNLFEVIDYYGGGGFTASQLESAMREHLNNAYVEDDYGNLVSGEVIREAFERMGFDGIVDNNVNKKFGSERQGGRAMYGMNRDTVHTIVFNPNQIKLSNPETYDNEGNVIPLSKRFNEDSEDIRYSTGEKNTSEKLQDGNESSNFVSAIISPYYNETAGTVEDAQRLRERSKYYNYVSKGVEIAKALGLRVDAVRDNIGGYQFDDGNFVDEISETWVFNLPEGDSFEEFKSKVDLFASLMGELIDEQQEAVISVNYVSEDEPERNGFEKRIRIKDINSAIQTIHESGIKNYTIDQKENVLILQCFDFENREEYNRNYNNLTNKLKYNDNLGKEEARAYPLSSRYLDKGVRRDRLEEWIKASSHDSEGGERGESQEMRGNVRALVEEAIRRSKERWGEDFEHDNGGVQGEGNTNADGQVRVQQGESRAVSERPVLRDFTERHDKNTQSFFSGVVNEEKYTDYKKKWEPWTGLNEGQRKALEAWLPFDGGFSTHINISIPYFREIQLTNIDAISKYLSNGGKVIDLCGSQGDFSKAIVTLNPTVTADTVDINGDMRNNCEQNPVSGVEFVQESVLGDYSDDETGEYYPEYNPKEKADVVHETMGFQFIMKDRQAFVDRIAEAMVKPDGIVILEEKIHPETTTEWCYNEAYKDARFKSTYWKDSDVAKKKEEVLTGMGDDQANEADLVAALKSRFKFVDKYWKSGNFVGYVASNSEDNLKRFRGLQGDTRNEFQYDNAVQYFENGVEADDKYSVSNESQDNERREGESLIDYAARISGGDERYSTDNYRMPMSPLEYFRQEQQNSENFKEWFGDWKNDPANASKVVDKDGRPKVMYHETFNDFNTFDPTISDSGMWDSVMPNGIFTKPTKKSIYGGGKQMPLYVNMRNPLTVLDRDDMTLFLENNTNYSEWIKPIQDLNAIVNRNLPTLKTKAERNAYRHTMAAVYAPLYKNLKANVQNAIKGLGYDGIHMIEDNADDGRKVEAYVVFDANQVKSASYNNGDFSKTNNDIRYSISENNSENVSADENKSVNLQNDERLQVHNNRRGVRKNPQAEDFDGGNHQEHSNRREVENSTSRKKSSSGDNERYSVSAKEDAEYMRAVESGDDDKAAEMVLKAAKDAGYTIKGYHGTTDGGFWRFDPNESDDGHSFFFTDNENMAWTYAGTYNKIDSNNPSYENINGIYHVALKMEHPYIQDCKGMDWQSIYPEGTEFHQISYYDDGSKPLVEDVNIFTEERELKEFDTEEEATEYVRRKYGDEVANNYGSTDTFPICDGELVHAESTRDIAEFAREAGFDGVILKNLLDNGKFGNGGKTTFNGNVYISFDSKNIKDISPVTYDDYGEPIPLSERFNENREDIRYSAGENTLFTQDERELLDQYEKAKTWNRLYGRMSYDEFHAAAVSDREKTISLLREFAEKATDGSERDKYNRIADEQQNKPYVSRIDFESNQEDNAIFLRDNEEFYNEAQKRIADYADEQYRKIQEENERLKEEAKNRKPEKRVFTEEEQKENDEIAKKAKKQFGTTSDLREAGYIMQDGSLIDLSGKRDASPSYRPYLTGRRTMDHRSISEVEEGSGTEAMNRFISRGNIRIMPESGTINLSYMPTDKQMSVLKRFIRRNEGDVDVEFNDKEGNSVHYVTYEGAKDARVAADIRKFYEDGIKPEGDEAYSVSYGNISDKVFSLQRFITPATFFGGSNIHTNGVTDNEGNVHMTVAADNLDQYDKKYEGFERALRNLLNQKLNRREKEYVRSVLAQIEGGREWLRRSAQGENLVWDYPYGEVPEEDLVRYNYMDDEYTHKWNKWKMVAPYDMRDNGSKVPNVPNGTVFYSNDVPDVYVQQIDGKNNVIVDNGNGYDVIGTYDSIEEAIIAADSQSGETGGPEGGERYSTGDVPQIEEGESLPHYLQRIGAWDRQSTKADADAKKYPAGTTPAQANEQRKQTSKSIRDRINALLKTEHVNAIDRRTLNGIMRVLENVTPQNEIQSTRDAEMLVRHIEMKAMAQDVEKLLKTKGAKANDKKQKIGKSIDITAQDILEKVNESARNMKLSGLEDQMHELRSQNWHLRNDEEYKDSEGNVLTDEQRQELIDKNSDQLAELSKAAFLLSKSTVKITAKNIESDINALEEKMGAEDYEENDADTEMLTALNIQRQLAVAQDMLMNMVEHQRDQIEAERKAREYNAVIRDGQAGDRLEEYKQKREYYLNSARGSQLLAADCQEGYIDAMDKAKEQLSGVIKEGRENFRKLVEEQKNRRKQIVHEGMMDATGTGKRITDYSDKEQNDRSKNDGWFGTKALFTQGLDSFKYMCEMIAKNTFGTDGYIYRRFITGPEGVQAAANNYAEATRRNMQQLNSKAEELFGMSYEDMMIQNMKVEDSTGIYRINPNTEDNEELALSKSQATYIYMLWKMTDGKAKLLKMGFNENSIAQVVSFIGEDNKQMADWLQGTFLPELGEHDNEMYQEIYGTKRASIENYVPIRINKTSVHNDNDIQEGPQVIGAMNNKVSSHTMRTVNSKPIDLSVDVYALMLQHADEVEDFYAYAKVRRDLTYLVNSKAFENQLNANDKGAYQRFVAAARIAVKTSPADINNKDNVDRIVSVLQKSLVGLNVSYRNTTALKQTLSVPAFFGYSQDPAYLLEFAKAFWGSYVENTAGFAKAFLSGMSMGIYDPKLFATTEEGKSALRGGLSETVRWCMDNLPDFWARVSEGVAGMYGLQREGIGNFIDKSMKRGMVANKTIDALTCCVGIKSIFEYKYKKQCNVIDATADRMLFDTEEGKQRWIAEAKEKARRLALMEASVYYNSTQQSTQPAFLSPLQVSKSSLGRMFALYKNSPISYARITQSAINDIGRYLDSSQRNRMVEEYAKRYMEEGYGEADAREMAKKYVFNGFRKSAFNVGLYGFFMNHIWNVGGKGFLGFYGGMSLMNAITALGGLGGDGDDPDKSWSEMNWDERWKLINSTLAYWMTIPMQGLPAVTLMQGYAQELTEGRNGFELSLINPELEKVWRDISRTNEDFGLISYEMLYLILARGGRFAGVPFEAFMNVALGTKRMIEDGGDLRFKDCFIDFMLMMNSPESQREKVAQELYIENVKSGKMSEDEFMTVMEKAQKYQTEGENGGISDLIDFDSYFDGKDSWWNEQKLTDARKKKLMDELELNTRTSSDRKEVSSNDEFTEKLDAAESLQELSDMFDAETDKYRRKRIQDKMKTYVVEGDPEQTVEGYIDSKRRKAKGLPKNEPKPKKTDTYDEMKEGFDVIKDLEFEDMMSDYKDVYDTWMELPEDEKGAYYKKHKDEIMHYKKLNTYKNIVNALRRNVATAKDKEKAMDILREKRNNALSK